jgi:histidyl-tRNA synthetase
LRDRFDDLDEDSRRRLETNPLRVLDSKNPDVQPILRDAPGLLEHLDGESRAHFDGLRAALDAAGIDYRINPRLVRGLDYYTRTVFEWLTDRLGAQSAVCAGGRYDGLVELLGGKATPAIGFAIGLERLVELVAQQGTAVAGDAPQVYVMPAGAPIAAVLQLAEGLRDRGLRAECHCGGGSPKSQLKRADRSGARYALLVETPTQVIVKDLRGNEGQRTLSYGDAVAHLAVRFDAKSDPADTSTRVENPL